MTVRRCKFLNITEAAVSVESFNALDWWVWDSEFTNNARGITNIFGARQLPRLSQPLPQFEHRRRQYAHTQFFGLRGNTSIGSNRFLMARSVGQNAASITLQDNKILDTIQTNAVADNNCGPLFLIDNVIRSKPGVSAPAVTMDTAWAIGPDFGSVGNTFTVAAPISFTGPNARSWAQDDQVVPYASVDGTIPTLPPTPVSRNRTVFEIAPGANGAAIQQAIDQAAAMTGQRPIVHLPKGRYSVGSTLSIPANADLQLVGDGTNSMLAWAGPAGGTVLRVNGPSKAVLRDFSTSGNGNAVGISIERADQVGARVFLDNFMSEAPLGTAVLADGLTNTFVELHGAYPDNGFGGFSQPLYLGPRGRRSRNQRRGHLWRHEHLRYLDPALVGRAKRRTDDGARGLVRRGDGPCGAADRDRHLYLLGRSLGAKTIHPGCPRDRAQRLQRCRHVRRCKVTARWRMRARAVSVTNENSQTQALFIGNTGDVVPYFNRTGSGGTVSFTQNKYLTRLDRVAADRRSGQPSVRRPHSNPPASDADRQAHLHHQLARRGHRRPAPPHKRPLRNHRRPHQAVTRAIDGLAGLHCTTESKIVTRLRDRRTISVGSASSALPEENRHGNASKAGAFGIGSSQTERGCRLRGGTRNALKWIGRMALSVLCLHGCGPSGEDFEDNIVSSPLTAGQGTGLTAQYFDNADLTNLKVTRTDATVNFDWVAGTPDPLIGSDTFSTRWTGQVEAPASGTYTFYTVSTTAFASG